MGLGSSRDVKIKDRRGAESGSLGLPVTQADANGTVTGGTDWGLGGKIKT